LLALYIAQRIKEDDVSSAAATAITPTSDGMESVLRYRSIIEAVRLIEKHKHEIHNDEDLGFTVSPAWRLLNNAARHLLKEANAVLRGEDLQ
jgi:hypothetical protein